MGNESQRPQGQQPSHDPNKPHRTAQQWESVVDEQIRNAQAAGQFDNLAGAGKPLEIDENPYAGDRRMAFSVLKSHGLAPREVELGKEIDLALARAEELLAKLRRQRESILYDQKISLERRRMAFATLRNQTAERYEAMLREIRSNVLSLNIIAPAPMHRAPVDVQERMRAFAAEFPA